MGKNYYLKMLKICLFFHIFVLGNKLHAQSANNECTGAIAIDNGTISGDNTGATQSMPQSTCGATNMVNDVWFTFTPTATGNAIINIDQTNVDVIAQVFSGTCGTLSNITCMDDGYPMTVAVTSGTTYYLRIYGFESAEGQFDVTLTLPLPPQPPPTNNECTGAIAISNGTVSGNNTGATQSIPQNTCGSASVANDVWFTFMPTATGNVTIDIDQTNVDAIAQVFSGTCGTLTSITCTDDNFPMTIAATSGTTYYLRVYGYRSEEGQFNVTLGGVALPITGSPLSGTIKDGKKHLAWSTFSEQNNRGFVIQRSADGKDFHNAGWVESKASRGNSQEQLEYSFIDQEIVAGTTYYRLQQTDLDGKISVSNIVRLSSLENSSFDIVAAPNPVSNILTINTYGPQGNHPILYVVDIMGKVLKTVFVKSAQTFISMDHLVNGVYLVKYFDGNHGQTVKVIKQ